MNGIASQLPARPMEKPPQVTATTPATKRSFWSRYSTLINFWLDVALLILFLVQAVYLLVFVNVVISIWK